MRERDWERDLEGARLRLDVLRLERDEVLFFFVCPAWRRCLFTVRAAISFARRRLVPRLRAEDLIFAY